MILKQYRHLFKITIILLTLTTLTVQKCISSAIFKYDLEEVSELVGYHSLCSQFSRRTCCSPNNFDLLAKKMTKIIGGNIGLSNACRYKITNAMCSLCDGDIGEELKKGYCPQYCWQFYEECKEDYFSFDNNNQLKVCKEDDIVCSKLKHIVSESQRQDVCSLFELKVETNSCWRGEVSANIKGSAKKKVSVNPKTRSKKGRSQSFWSFLNQYKTVLIPLLLFLVLLGLYLKRKAQIKYDNWKRQIRNH